MSDSGSTHLVVLSEAAQALRAHFLGWQCRVRQFSVRQGGGRPTSGMRPRVLLVDPEADLGPTTVLINKREPQETTAQFRHVVRKTHDPVERYESALKMLSAAYFQQPEDFSDELTALFGAARPSAIVIGALGRVGTGAIDLCEKMGVAVTKWDLAETAHGGPFPEILQHDIFLNAILAQPGSPVFLPVMRHSAGRA